ncbi:MAG TPA: outer membrane lipoprotein-sorting protein [Bryobacteraceae bacterium]|nr:outer membrane lipoprotein-sorting protein [Bryobacteraceae bacterium]
MGPSRLWRAAAILALALTSSSCLFRRTAVNYGAKPGPSSEPLKLLTTTAAILNQQLGDNYDAIHSFIAKSEMIAKVGSVYRSAQITELTYSATTTILFRKPAALRLQGHSKVVGTLFDLASQGGEFHLTIPSKSLYVVGQDSAPAASDNPIENMRPRNLLDALLVKPADLTTERIFLQDDTDVDHAWYVLQIARKGADDTDLPDRTVWFDRLDFHVVRQRIYDPTGLIVSDTKYDKWKAFNGIQFPMHIDASFKKDGYGTVIDISDVQMNPELTDQQFELPKPEGYTVKDLGK